jgi:hypothetical protein
MNRKNISCRKTSRAFIALTFPLLFLTACGTDSNAQVASVIQKEVATWSGVTNVATPEVMLVRELTATDSLLLLNDLILIANEDYNRQITLLKANAQYLAKAKSKLYFTNGEVNPYYKKEVDGRIEEMKRVCSEINTFSDGLAGKYELNRGHIFRPYNELKNKKSAIVTKVYKATLNYSQTTFNGSVRSGTAKKTEIRYFFLSPDGTQVIKSADNFSLPQGTQTEFLKFERYSVDNEGVIKIVSNEADAKSEVTTIVAKYVGAESIGYCNVTFETDAGEEIYFIDPELGEYSNEDCGMKDSFVGRKFKISFAKGEIEVHSEEGNETLETEIIKTIELIQ